MGKMLIKTGFGNVDTKVSMSFELYGLTFCIHRPLKSWTDKEFRYDSWEVSEYSTGTRVLGYPEKTRIEAKESAIKRLTGFGKSTITLRMHEFEVINNG